MAISSEKAIPNLLKEGKLQQKTGSKQQCRCYQL